MMKSLIQGLAVASAAMGLLVGVSTSHLAEAVTQSELAQSGRSTQSGRVLEVALPEFATVRLTSGGSVTGKLTSFSAGDLTLSASGQSRTLPHAQVRQVEMGGTVWVPNPDGNMEAYRIRGLSQSLENVPVSALAWNDSSSLANLNLQGVLTQGEFNRLTRNPSLIHALIRVNFESSNSNTMNITVRSLARSR
jgi:hypothetical protein